MKKTHAVVVFEITAESTERAALMIQELTGSLLYPFTDEDQPRIRPAALFVGDEFEVVKNRELIAAAERYDIGGCE